MGISVNSPTERRRRSPPSLPDDLFDEILLRLPPDEPAIFVRFCLVCKSWSRRLKDPSFLRRYRAFHGKSPMVGFFFSLRGPGSNVAQFVPTSSFRPNIPHPSNRYALDSHHGRVLFHTILPGEGSRTALAVWDSRNGDERELRLPDFRSSNWNAAVLCASRDCNHVHCNGFSFQVVFVGTAWDGVTSASFYSSEAGAWDNPSSLVHPDATIHTKPAILVDAALFFLFPCDHSNRIIEFDMLKRKLRVIETPIKDQINTCFLVTLKGGGLGLAVLKNFKINLWSREPAETNGWLQCNVIDLKNLLPSRAFAVTPRLIGFAEGVLLLIVWTADGVFTIDFWSGQAKKIYRSKRIEEAIPLMTFYTPKQAY